MKSLLVYLAAICVSQFSFSQNSIENNTLIESEIVALTTLNSRYIGTMQFEDLAVPIKELQTIVSQFDLKSKNEYEGFSNPFEVNFKSSKGNIIATYNEKGKIIETVESFKSVKLPEVVRNRVFKRYPGWSLLNADYFAHYSNGAKKIQYEITIGKESEQRKLKVNENGKML